MIFDRLEITQKCSCSSSVLLKIVVNSINVLRSLFTTINSCYTNFLVVLMLFVIYDHRIFLRLYTQNQGLYSPQMYFFKPIVPNPKGSGSIGRAVTSNTRGLWFWCSHQQNFIINIFACWKDGDVEELGMTDFKKWQQCFYFKNLT